MRDGNRSRLALLSAIFLAGCYVENSRTERVWDDDGNPFVTEAGATIRLGDKRNEATAQHNNNPDLPFYVREAAKEP